MDSMREFLASRKPTPALAVAFIALLAALSGTAVALPGTNSVDSGDIKNKQVKGKDLANNAVTGKKVKNSSLGGGDVKNDALTGDDVNESTLGQVPTANSANTANTADTATSATNAGKVDGFDAAELGGRVAQAHLSSDNFITAGSNRDLLSVDVTAPKAGFLVASFSGGGLSNSAAACPCVLQGRLKLDGGGYNFVTYENIDATEFSGGFKRFSMAGSRMYPVTAGAHTVIFNINAQTGTATAQGVTEPNLLVTYIPFDGTGN
jgi:hypothetical protein